MTCDSQRTISINSFVDESCELRKEGCAFVILLLAFTFDFGTVNRIADGIYKIVDIGLTEAQP